MSAAGAFPNSSGGKKAVHVKVSALRYDQCCLHFELATSQHSLLDQGHMTRSRDHAPSLLQTKERQEEAKRVRVIVVAAEKGLRTKSRRNSTRRSVGLLSALLSRRTKRIRTKRLLALLQPSPPGFALFSATLRFCILFLSREVSAVPQNVIQ